jgi:uncharacterized protein YneF (UPF0154 family)
METAWNIWLALVTICVAILIGIAAGVALMREASISEYLDDPRPTSAAPRV